MPRILPRLLQSIGTKTNAKVPKVIVRPPRHQSMWRCSPVHASFAPHGRHHSILLDLTNPISNSDQYVQHKALPPQVSTSSYPSSSHDTPRQMTVEERSWWSSPCLRMLSSPLRLCMLTLRYLPSDFLIRLVPLRVPSSRSSREVYSLIPDGLEHPKFKNRKSGHAAYVVCWKLAVQHLKERGAYKRVTPRVSMHSLLIQQICHLLRVRVLQELKILAERLQAQLQSGDTPILRRLTRAEFNEIKETGVIPYENALALLVVPPLNKDPTTKQRPEPSLSPSAPDEKEPPDISVTGQTPPPSVLYTVGATKSNPDGGFSPVQVPLYNAVTLFPSRPQRAALHACLLHLLAVERKARFRDRRRASPSESSDGVTNRRPRGDQKASHVFLLFSDAWTCTRADAAATAIALWRLRMWEGAGWEGEPNGSGQSSVLDWTATGLVGNA